MPGLNGKGPEGKGPRTGRGLGNCGSGKKTTGSRPRLGRGGRGRGRGRGFGRRR